MLIRIYQHLLFIDQRLLIPAALVHEIFLALKDYLNILLLFWCSQFKPDEMAGIMKDFDQPGHLAPTGLLLGGTKYMVIQGEAGAVIRGKKVMYTIYVLRPWELLHD